MTAARLTVDLDALAHNFHFVQRLAGSAEVTPVVKADGYGLGAVAAGRRLVAEGARGLYVARLAEGEALRAALPGVEIRVFDGCGPEEADRLREARLTPVLSSLAQVDAWRGGGGGRAALMIDTGMNRLGLELEEARRLAEGGGLPDLVAVLSHLACADAPEHAMNARQLARFQALRAAFPGARASLANSAGVWLGGEYLMDEVRPGIALYGGDPRHAGDDRLRPVAVLEAPVLQVRDVRAGETVGYGAAFTASRAMRVAIAAAGYADGVLRAGAPGLYGCLDGRDLPVLGRISMDLIALDVSDHPTAAAGDLVELLGAHRPLDAAAQASGTMAYELLVRLGSRLERRWIGAAA